MAKKEQFEPTKFSLIVRGQNFEKEIIIPATKRGINKRLVGGVETYLMAIDDFTTRFSNKEALLKYAKENKLVSFPYADYDSLHLKIEYVGKGEYNFNHQVLYSDKKELIDFIKNNEIKEQFPPNNSYVYDFEKTIVKHWTSGMYQLEYRMFMTDYNNRYFGLDLIKILNKIKEENLMDRVKNGDSVIAPLSHYHNLRGHFMTIGNLEEILFKITREKFWSYQDRVEYEREERLEKMKEQSNQEQSIKLDVVKIPETKTVVAEKQPPKQLALFEDSLFATQEEQSKQR